jgi:hypothetical protein
MDTITNWRTSTRSSHNGNCVEVGFDGERIAVRDTKNRASGHFTVPAERWSAFVARVKQGAFAL